MSKMIRTIYEASRVVARLENEVPTEKPVEESIYESSIDQIKDFIRSHVWKDMCDTLGGMTEQLHLLLSTESDIDTIRKMQGNIQMLLFLAELPESMLDELLTDKQIRKEEDDEDDNSMV